jgi:hypothetical protein
MNKRRVLIMAATLLCGLALVLSADESSVLEGLTTALAQETASINRWVVSGGGGEASDGGKVAVNSTLGQPIIGHASGGSISQGAGYWYGAAGDPTAVTLASFSATPQAGGILIAWETAMEIDTVGFNLYRAQSPDGPYVKLNDTLIPSQSPGSVFGATYAWLDEGVQDGITYYYKLEDVEVSGQSTFHGPVSATAQIPTAVSTASFRGKRRNGVGAAVAGVLFLSLIGLAVARRRT